jgi:hypothetical protein
MRTGHNLFSAVQFLTVTALLCAGGFFVALPYAPGVRCKLASFLMNRPDLFLVTGLTILGLGFLLLIGFFFMLRRRYFQVVLKGSSAEVEPALLSELAGAVWKKHFQDATRVTDVVVHGNQTMELVVETPQSPDPILLEKVEKELTHMLEKQLKYKRDLFVTVIIQDF